MKKCKSKRAVVRGVVVCGGMGELRTSTERNERTKMASFSCWVCVLLVKQQRNKIKQEEIDFSLFFRFFKLLHFYSFLFLAELAVVTNFATFLMLFFRLAFLFSCLFFVGFCCFAALAFS